MPYEKGENKPDDRSQGQTQGRTVGQEERPVFFSLRHDLACPGAVRVKKVVD